MPIELRLSAAGKRENLAVMLQDGHDGFTPLGYRGSGVRRVVTLLAALMEHDLTKDYIILIDEPETSLHADSQHFLRTLLEELASRPTVQVIYATHSPSMINVMRPHSLRLLSRVTRDGKATSVINNRPFQENYLPIRSSLGLNPADSLLYAPLTIIVEGDTEVIGLQLLLKKLMDQKVAGFEDTERLLSQTHILNGMGDKFTFMCELAKSQGAKPILFLDGDKKRRLREKKVAEQLSGVPTITLDDGKEFEQLLSDDTYFRAIANYLGDTSGDINPVAFRTWEQSETLPTQMVFTKRVNRWLESKSLPDLDKVAVIRRAIAASDVANIDTSPLLELVKQMKESFSGGLEKEIT